MSRIAAVLPAPSTSVVLALIWLILAGDLSAAQWLLAAGFGLALPLFTARFRAWRLPVRRVDTVLSLAGVFAYDLIVANLVVAHAVLGSMARVQPHFVEVPLDLDDPAAAALLAALVALTPGSVPVDLDHSARRLTVHMLLAGDARAAAQRIKTHYEARIREIFQC